TEEWVTSYVDELRERTRERVVVQSYRGDEAVLESVSDVQENLDAFLTNGGGIDTDTLYIDSVNNRVGIGTTAPADTLSVNGPIYITDSTPTTTTNRLYS